MTMPGPGDPATWGPPTGHPHDPRTSESYGPCDICGDETDIVVDQGVDADEDGEYGWVLRRCQDCEDLLDEMANEPEEVARGYRALQDRLEYITGVAKAALNASQGR